MLAPTPMHRCNNHRDFRSLKLIPEIEEEEESQRKMIGLRIVSVVTIAQTIFGIEWDIVSYLIV